MPGSMNNTMIHASEAEGFFRSRNMIAKAIKKLKQYMTMGIVDIPNQLMGNIAVLLSHSAFPFTAKRRSSVPA